MVAMDWLSGLDAAAARFIEINSGFRPLTPLRYR
jgi:hypothetical protein